MREVLSSVVPAAEVLEGTAEQLPLPDASTDAVTVAQAFHWFRGQEALAEIHRVLRPGGRLGLIWNRRHLDQPVQAELARVMESHRGATPSQDSGAWMTAFRETRSFGPLAQEDFPMEQVVDREQLVARVLSVSFMAALPPDQQAAVAAEVAEIANRYGDPVTLSYTTSAYCARRWPRPSPERAPTPAQAGVGPGNWTIRLLGGRLVVVLAHAGVAGVGGGGHDVW